MQELLRNIASHFQIKPFKIKVEQILHGSREKQNVRRLKISEKSYLLKQHEITVPVTKLGFTPFQIEKFTLSALHNAGCLVPKLIWNSEKDHALLLEWRGERTLDSLAQRNTVVNIQAELHTIIKELCKIESVFAKNIDPFEPYIFQFDVKETLQGVLHRGRKTVGYLQQLSKTPLTSSQIEGLDAAWTSLSNRLLDAPITLDSLDYQARNIVIDAGLPSFIDFASIGWDWQERRFVQYFNSLGSYQDGARFVSLLDRELVESYAEWVVQHREDCSVSHVVARVDGHHLLFYLSVAYKILEATARPEVQENKILVEAWGDLHKRYQQAISLIIDTDLSDDLETNLIRGMIRNFTTTLNAST